MQVIAEALRENNVTRDGKTLGTYLKANTFSTVMGPKNFDSKGDLKVSDYVVYVWSPSGGGKFDYAQVK